MVRLAPLPETQPLDLIVPSLMQTRLDGTWIDDADDLLILGAEHDTLAALWDICPRVDWMRWLVDRAVRWAVITPAEGHPIVARIERLDPGDAGLPEAADAIRQSFGNPFAWMDDAPLRARRQRVTYWIREGAGPLTERLVTLFR
jgi:hypothetical protein